MLRAAAIALIVGALAVACTEDGSSPPAASTETPGSSGTVRRVIDGDTVRVGVSGVDELVRLIGIDTPEVENPHRPAGCFGEQASAFARSALPVGTRVILIPDPTQEARDRFGRLLAYVHPEGEPAVMASINARLVSGGYARVYAVRDRPFAHLGAYREAEGVARRAARGLWGACRSG